MRESTPGPGAYTTQGMTNTGPLRMSKGIKMNRAGRGKFTSGIRNPMPTEDGPGPASYEPNSAADHKKCIF